ncbi:MAG TPA: response regulator [Gemmataceae bacterium]|jgi:signal transduction histidine kinase/DNA-binding response OmpR family regulator|nr:response regulator [Gemmataceae bacterium]
MPNSRSPTILHVDDDADARYVLAWLLRDAGFQVTEAATGADALRLVAEEPDLVLLDVHLPDLSGLEVCRRIKASPATSSIPILHLSATAVESLDKVQGLDGGADGYLTEPVDPAELIGSVKALLRVRQSEKEARVSARQWQAMFDAIGDAVCLLDPRGAVLRCNRPMAQLLRKPFRQIIGWPYHELVRDALGPAEAPAFARGQETRHLEIGELAVCQRWFRVTTAPVLDEEGVVTGSVHTWVDITARRLAEEERGQLLAREQAARAEAETLARSLRDQHKWLEGVLDLLPIPMLLIEPGTARVTFANKAADAMAGGAFPKGKPAEEYHSVYFCTDAEGARIPDDRMPGVRVARGERLEGFEMDWNLPSGKRALLVHAEPLPAMHGHPGIAVMVFQDVSRQKQVEEELRKTDRAKDDFLAVLGHELRNPLSPLLNALHVLRREAAQGPVFLRMRAMMERQVRHMSRLVDDLLDVSRIGRNKVLLRKERLDLVPLVRTAAEDHRAGLEAAELTLEVELPDRPVWVLGDPTRLSQVVGNLLQNAGKFTDAGGRVDVRVAKEPSGQRAVVTVRDTGIGIDAEMLPRLFETFTQALGSVGRSRGGLGLGLALVKGLIELHGGEVVARSAGLGRGAEFTLWVPLHTEPPAPAAETPELAPLAPGELRILLIEDNHDVLETLRVLLEFSGHSVAVARSGAAGVEAARRWLPDVVLSDIGLPGALDGYAVARELRRDPALAKTRLIAMSGYGSQSDKRQCLEAGFEVHLVKPIDPEELARVLASRSAGTS